MTHPLLLEIPALDALLHQHADALGPDYAAYRNHTYRVANLCLTLCGGDTEQVQKIATAAAFHDLGIWTARTFDYLPPSVDLACDHLHHTGRQDWSDEISRMILEHHRIRSCRQNLHWLVEPFRQADWIDVSHGVLSFGLPRALLRDTFAHWPNEGFHKRLAQLTLKRLRTHPLSPLPMLRF